MTQGAPRFAGRFATRAIAACVLVFTAALTAPLASASPADDAFVSALKTLNVPTASDDAAIQIGHNVCAAVDAGKIEPAPTVRGLRSALVSQGLTKSQAINVIWAAVDSYCPENRALVGR